MRNVAVVLMLVCCVSLGSCMLLGERQSSEHALDIEVANYPTDQKEQWPLVKSRCSDCHDLDYITGYRERIRDWGPVVRRMARETGSPIMPGEIPKLAGFLNYYSSLPR